MITLNDIQKVTGFYESGFGDLSIAKVFAIGMLKGRCDVDEQSWRVAKSEGILDIPKLKPTKVDDKSVKAFYRELSRSKKIGEKFDKTWLGLTGGYFRPDSPLISSDVIGPRNSAFYSGEEMYELRSTASGRAPAFTDYANNTIAAFYEKANSREIIDEFKKSIATELVSPLIARSLDLLNKDTSEHKNIIINNPLSWATKFMEDYEIIKPPIYGNLKPVVEFLYQG